MADATGKLQPYLQAPTPDSWSPSPKDIINRLTTIFGPPAQPDKVRDYTDQHAATFNFPDAFVGRSHQLRETMKNLIVDQAQTWHVTVGLPYLEVNDSVVVAWDEMRFDKRILQRVPYQGASRLMTAIRTSHRETMERRGVAIIVESDFYRHATGKKYFADQIQCVRECVERTMCYDVMFAYLTCLNHDHWHDHQMHAIPHRNMLAAMKKDIQLYGCVQRDDMGLEFAVEIARQNMARYMVEPNMLIMAPQTQLYVSMAPESKQVYSKGGERGLAQFYNYRGNEPWTIFRGMAVYTATPFEAGPDQDAQQMLRRNVQIGEFYTSAPPRYYDVSKEKLSGKHRSIAIYDERDDRIKMLSFREMVEHAVPWLLDTDQKNALHDSIKATDHLRKSEETAMAAGFTANTVKTFLNTDAKAKAEEKEWWMGKADGTKGVVQYVEAGVWVGVCLVVARPFIEHETLSAIITVAGADTGNTLIGPSDLQIASNTTVKTIEGHYTCHTAAVITKPQNVYVLPNIQVVKYIAGGGTRWFGDVARKYKDGELIPGDLPDLNVDDIKDDLLARLDERREGTNEYSDLLCFAAPCEPDARYSSDHIFALTDAPHPWDIGNGEMGERNFPGGVNFFNNYGTLFSMPYISAGADPTSTKLKEFIRNGTANNAVCIEGPHRVYSSVASNGWELVTGKGHFGPDAVPGDAAWRSSMAVSQKTARSQHIGGEMSLAMKREWGAST